MELTDDVFLYLSESHFIITLPHPIIIIAMLFVSFLYHDTPSFLTPTHTSSAFYGC
jgi:hypothetical protein